MGGIGLSQHDYGYVYLSIYIYICIYIYVHRGCDDEVGSFTSPNGLKEGEVPLGQTTRDLPDVDDNVSPQ